jgi:ABC-type transport system substrate-binding protein
LYYSTAFTNVESVSPALRSLLTIDEAGEWSADLATDVPSVENGGVVANADAPADCVTADAPTGDCFTLNVSLKPGYSWSDGKPVTLNDFLATYNQAALWGEGAGCSGCSTMVPLLDPLKENGLYDVSNRYISDIKVADDGMSMTVTWQKNYAAWLGWASSTFFQADWVATIDATAGPSSIPLDGVASVPWNGPFKMIAASSDGIDYDRNPGWGGTPPKLATLHEQFYAGKDGMITDFLAGNVDLALDMTQADFASISSVDPSVGKASLDDVWQYEHLDLNVAGGTRLGGTQTKKGLDDVEVRTAIAMAVNKQGMIDVLFPGAGVKPACSIAPPGTAWRDESVTCAAYDPTAAAAKLDAAGWTVNEDTGLRTNADGDTLGRLQLCTTAGNPTRLTELGRLSQDLLAIGIPSDISTADASAVVFAGWADTTNDTNCSIYRGTYDIADYAFVLGADVYGNYYYTYAGSQIPTDDNPNGSNTGRLNNDDMNAALTAIGTEIDVQKQYELAKTVQQVVAQQNNEIPIYYRAETTGLGARLGGWGKYNPASVGPTWHVEDWFQAAP